MRTKDKKITEAIEKHGAFFAFTSEQLNEKKKEGVQYQQCGGGLICPADNVKALLAEVKNIAEDEKERKRSLRAKRALALKKEELPRGEKIKNRVILLKEATARIQNYMDCMELQEAVNTLTDAEDKEEILKAIEYILTCVRCSYYDRPEVEDVYDENIKIIEELKREIKNI